MVRSALLAAIVCGAEAALPCDPVHLPTRGPGPAGAVCRCNATYCDTIEPLGAVSGASAVFYQTSLGSDTDRLTRHETTFSPSVGSEWQRIEVNATQRYQSIIGFGGALTDAAALNYAALSPAPSGTSSNRKVPDHNEIYYGISSRHDLDLRNRQLVESSYRICAYSDTIAS